METLWQVNPPTSAGLPARSTARFWRKLIELQTRWTRRFDEILPPRLRRDGNRDFLDNLVPRHLRSGMLVYDVGGGKNPVIGPARKSELALTVVGLDIDAGQLASAAPAAYDETVCADICSYRGRGDADLVVCQALLEHVPDVGLALQSIASILKPGGLALIFVPCRNALYARINLLLPQRLKLRILYAVFPEMSRCQGFPAWYDRCTPAALDRLLPECGLVRVRRRLYFHSDYFRFCFPLHAAWRIWLMLFRRMAGAEAAETLSLVLRKGTPAAEGTP